MILKPYTFGMGDRFAHEGVAQLSAVVDAQKAGIAVFPVWNKSHREHTIVGSIPADLRAEADEAVKTLDWDDAYYIDADHIGLKTVDGFLDVSNFFTLDIAEYVGKAASEESVEEFVAAFQKYTGELVIPGIEAPVTITDETLRAAAGKFLLATEEAGKIFRYIVERKGPGTFVTEVSADETDTPQTPVELFLMLGMLGREGIPAQTIAPKFTGRFNKGVDYVGDLEQFEKEFDEDLAVITFAVKEFGLPGSLKLSVHSGSDKFSIYPIINRLIKKHGAGLHVKTAGTTWLEEIIGLAEAGGEGLAVAKAIYAGALEKMDALTAPYATVIDIDPEHLPDAAIVKKWTGGQFVAALRHDPDCRGYNPHFRQLLHVGFKVAAQMGERFTRALQDNREDVARNVKKNLLDRHIRPIFE